jgi:hypothetical protein
MSLVGTFLTLMYDTGTTPVLRIDKINFHIQTLNLMNLSAKLKMPKEHFLNFGRIKIFLFGN